MNAIERLEQLVDQLVSRPLPPLSLPTRQSVLGYEPRAYFRKYEVKDKVRYAELEERLRLDDRSAEEYRLDLFHSTGMKRFRILYSLFREVETLERTLTENTTLDQHESTLLPHQRLARLLFQTDPDAILHLTEDMIQCISILYPAPLKSQVVDEVVNEVQGVKGSVKGSVKLRKNAIMNRIRRSPSVRTQFAGTEQ